MLPASQSLTYGKLRAAMGSALNWLTGVLVIVAVLQLLVYWELLKVEKLRTRTEVFPRLKLCEGPAVHTAILDISNLSGIGIWAESAILTVQLPDGFRAESVPCPIELVIPAYSSDSTDVQNYIRQAVSAKVGREFKATVEARVWYRANSKVMAESTGRYEVDLTDYGVYRVSPVG